MINLLALGVAAAPAVGSLAVKTWQRVFRRHRHASGGVAEPLALPSAGSQPLAPPAPPPLPPEWERWQGARPEPRGWPPDTILAVHGLDTTTPEFRAGLLDLCAELQVPVDSLAVIIANESGCDPKALNPLPAAGLIQLTVGAHLDGYDTADKIRAVIKLSAVEQLPIIRGYYLKIGQRAKGAHPGMIYMLNFLPNHAGKDESFILGKRRPEAAPGQDPIKLSKEDEFSAKVYELNIGFDGARKGHITIADVYAAAAIVAKRGHDRRIAVDGSIVTVTHGAAAPSKLPAEVATITTPSATPKRAT